MKKLDKHQRWLLDGRNRRRLERQRKRSLKPPRGLHNLSAQKRETLALKEMKERHRTIAGNIHRGFSYSKGTTAVLLEGSIGIEEAEDQDAFLTVASRCIDFNTSGLLIDLRKASRVWPTTVTLLCSLIEWIEAGSRYSQVRLPTIASTDSDEVSVTAYLDHCGFHEYVGRHGESKQQYFAPADVVKIQREKRKESAVDRENELYRLMERHAAFDADELELFNCIIFTETFANVTEHGMVIHDRGWWTLAQHHPRHKVISLCIADNGIGIKNTLEAGPQAGRVRRTLGPSAGDDEYIKLALTVTVSGAFDAPEDSTTTGREKGSRRGNGLKKIVKTCSTLHVRLSILSHYGYVFLNDRGEVIKSGSMKSRVFGGTMYTYVIPAKGEEQ